MRSLTPDKLADTLGERCNQPVWVLVLDLYAAYQTQLQDLDAVDYTDLLRLAVAVLEQNPQLRQRLEQKWPYVLEDEAQDSNRLQERIIKFLTREHSNWVRVGDPNQSINTTFSGADASLLPAFLAQPETRRFELPQSGRCALAILEMANHLISWSQDYYRCLDHVEGLRLPLIEPTDSDDPQPNPKGFGPPVAVFLPVANQMAPWERTSERMADLIRDRMQRQGADQYSWAVLMPTQQQALGMVKRLRTRSVPVDDSLIRVSDSRRRLIQALALSLRLTVDPRPQVLAELWYEFFRPKPDRSVTDTPDQERTVPGLGLVENSGVALDDWLTTDLDGFDCYDAELPAAKNMQSITRRWLDSVALPADEFVLLAAQDLFTSPIEIAICFCLAGHLGEYIGRLPNFDFDDCATLLEKVANGAERLELPDEGSQYTAKPGTVTVCTMHGAKGLEWDRVFLMGLNNFAFPADPNKDRFMSRSFYLERPMGFTSGINCCR